MLWKFAEKGSTGARIFKEERNVLGSISRPFMLERKNLMQKVETFAQAQSPREEQSYQW